MKARSMGMAGNVCIADRIYWQCTPFTLQSLSAGKGEALVIVSFLNTGGWNLQRSF